MNWNNYIVSLSQKVYQKGIYLSKQAMRVIQKPKWDILIRPA
jgi:hypothetical protein